ncbi:hypothetical protein [Ulvibacter antarcticus]|uniref:Lipoprotein n=1 Tax=Ulvibacter antarcticus TaxID=442714 RepID=A0A3L9YDL5_9FLAO|nr:hypothetical protein [Ulvibacter antarcticus]RMA58786.1 hypothetical protein BXY75_2164 [Ulvibacter antarcticus]
MKHLIFAISILTLVGCKDGKNQENAKKTDAIEQTTDATEDRHHDHASNLYDNSWTVDIEMNKGAKWKANIETTVGVEKMQALLKTQTTTSLEEYHQLANKLNEDKNSLIQNCTMKGPSHDNLHIWLMPLIDKIGALSEAKTVEEASKLKHSIEENINAYSDYFE